jgi:hypothetical protein
MAQEVGMQTARAPARQAVSQAIRDRLARLLGMVGSTHDGEALNAARLADKLVRQMGVSWSEILADPASAAPNVLIGWPARWRSALQACGQHGARLGERERSFVESLATYKRTPSPKQLVWLRSITERVIEAGGGR